MKHSYRLVCAEYMYCTCIKGHVLLCVWLTIIINIQCFISYDKTESVHYNIINNNVQYYTLSTIHACTCMHIIHYYYVG